jgi:hypothetical protein
LSGAKNPELAMPGELKQFRDLVLQVAQMESDYKGAYPVAVFQLMQR